MTVKELFNHFSFFPEKIIYCDKTKDEILGYEKSLSDDDYSDFIESIVNKEIEHWYYSDDGSMILALGNEKFENEPKTERGTR